MIDLSDIRKELQALIDAEEQSGRTVDINRLNQLAQTITQTHNSAPRDDFNGLSPEQMHQIIYNPFSDNCVVRLNRLSEEQYMKIPLVRQTLFLMNTLSEKELKLTKLGWLPLKVVNEAYHIGRPEWIIEEFNQKRINEYEANSVWMSHIILELLGWVKTRKGMLSLTAKGRKALSNVGNAANEILRCSLVSVGLHTFDGYEDNRIGNWGRAYSVLLLNKFGDDWHPGYFYLEHYQKVFGFASGSGAYATRIFSRLFYWLGIADMRQYKQAGPPFVWEYKKTDLLPIIFSFENI